MRKLTAFAAALAAAAVFTGCTEVAQEPGKSYAGKEDSKPYAGDQFKGDKAKWEASARAACRRARTTTVAWFPERRNKGETTMTIRIARGLGALAVALAAWLPVAASAQQPAAPAQQPAAAAPQQLPRPRRTGTSRRRGTT